ncbi:MAG: gliding motility protein [[Eubacterium] sulci]|nr:gliding motility protein [[Eubacterium] sulci]
MIAKAGDIYCVYNKSLKKYTACQVTKIDESGKKPQAIIISLDWASNELPKEEELALMKPLYIDYMYWNGTFNLKRVDVNVPSNYVYVGNLAPLNNEDTGTYGGWSIDVEVYNQFKWLKIPKEQRDVFKAADASSEHVEFEGNRRRLNTHSENDNWHDFDDALSLRVFPCLSSLTVTKWHKNLFEYLNSNPFIRELVIENHGKSSLDFSETTIDRLSVDMTGLDELILNDDLSMLFLLGEVKDGCKIKSPSSGVDFILHCDGFVPKLQGLEGLEKLYIGKIKELDIADILREYPKLRELRLWGSPGNLINFAKISEFSELEVLTTMELFGFTADEVPKPEKLQKLYMLWMDSLPEDAAREVKKLYKKRKSEGLDLWITKPRKAEWLAQNLENPFRSWDGEEHITPANAKKAADIYRKTRASVIKLVDGAGKDIEKDAEALVRDYTEGFNKMDRKKPFIDTVERDEVFTALDGILSLIPDEFDVDKDKLIDLFDQLKEF